MRFIQLSFLLFIQVTLLLGQQTPNCGRRLVNHEPLITNGYPSNEGAWPWHAAIYHIEMNHDIAYKCGGTVITSRSILTAAHCLYQNGRPIIPERVLVHLGKHNLLVSGPHTQEFEVNACTKMTKKI